MSGNEKPAAPAGPDPAPRPVPPGPAAAPGGARFPGVLDAILRLYRWRGRLLLGISIVFEVPAFAVSAFLGARMVADMTGLLGFSPLDPPATLPDTFPPLDPALMTNLTATLLGLVALGLVVGTLLTAALGLAVSEVVAGRPAGVLPILGRIARRMPALLVSEVLYLCLVGGVFLGGLVVASVPLALSPDPASGGPLVFVGIVFFVAVVVATVLIALRLAFWPQVVALEGLSGVAAFRRSWRLVTGSTWRVLGYAVALGLLGYMATLILSQLGGIAIDVAGRAGAPPVTLQIGWNVVVTVLVAPIAAAGMTLLFLDLRRRGA
jgi:hypothetical protein